MTEHTHQQEPNLALPVNLPGFVVDGNDPRRPVDRDSWPKDAAEGRFGVQFREPLREDQYEEFRQAFGLSLDSYVSELTYLELIDEPTLRRLQSHPLVNAVFPYEARYKLAPEIAVGLADPEQQGRRDIILRVMLFPEADPDAIAREIGALGGKRIGVSDRQQRHGPPRVSFRLPRVGAKDAIDQIAAIDAVRWIEDVPATEDDAGAPSGLVQSGAANAVPLTQANLRGDNQIIAVYDNGPLDINHCWFKDAPPNQQGKYHRKVVWIYKTRSPLATTDHAYFVAGICAGREYEDGHAPVADPGEGIAPNAKLVYCDRNIFDGSQTTPTLIQYLDRAARRGARIHNTSWHSERNGEYRQDSADVDRFSWEHEDCLVVCSSGNNGEELGPPNTAKNGLCVSASYVAAAGTFLGDGADGKTADGRRKPDLIAPGCDIASVLPAGGCQPELFHYGAEEPCGGRPGVPNTVCCGASFATPVVSGAAAIVRQFFIEGRHPTGVAGGPPVTPSGALLKAVLLNATAKTDSATDYPDSTFAEGWGNLQLNLALYPADPRRKLWVRDVWNANGLHTGDVRSSKVRVVANDIPLKVTLVWTDPPTDAYLAPVVNDLDLEVRAPGGGARYLGNNFQAGGVESAAGGIKRDQKNNVEMVLVTAPTPGEWTITVRAQKANPWNGKPQGYALAVTGALA
jgi:hypothetical protein